MKIYFVRHGSTELLENRISQGDEEPLSEDGQKQAKSLAKRFEGVPIDLVVSSSLKRALETAEEVSKDVIISELFREIRKPSEVIGNSRDDLEMKKIIETIREKYVTDPNWHYSDEESFNDFLKRGKEALDFLINSNKENILVVTHGNFISLLFGLMFYGPNLTGEIFMKLRQFLRMNNTGISICVYEENKWKLHCWNDTAHCPE